MWSKAAIPNALTMANLASGFLAIFLAYNNQLEWAAYAVLLGALFDVLDGGVARALQAKSPIGGDLDSLADVVSFGVAPATILLQLGLALNRQDVLLYALFAGALAHVVGTAYRLARFNQSGAETKYFKGLPSPAAGLLLAGMPLLPSLWVQLEVLSPLNLSILGFLTAFLMASSIKMFSLKQWGNLLARIYILISGGVGVLALIFTGQAALSATIFAYIVLSLFYNMHVKKSS